ncbi:ABC transporter substrate-binding protein [Desertihabitans brevis]|nr:extracellular solute-binding protein [Desertihabitans brevis]
MSRSTTASAAGTISRRRLIGAAFATAGGTVAAPWLTGCTGSQEPGQGVASGGGETTGAVTWWDQFRPLTTLFEEELFAPFTAAHPGVTVERREMDGPSMGQALQLGRRSNQLPDVHSLAGLDGSPASLVGAGWFQPIDEFVDVEGSPVGELLLDGIHRFDGRVYTVPVFSSRWHDAIPWLNTELCERADVDPETSPGSWDAFRAALQQLRGAGGDDVHPMVIGAKDPSYLASLLNRLAQTAGAAGAVDPRTGEYAYASEPYLQAMEWLLSLQTDGLLHPSSASMDTRDARARWAAGEAAVYPWGPWFIGGLKVQEPEAVERGVGVWHIPTVDGSDPVLYSEPPGGTFWVSSQAQRAQLGAELMLRLVDPEFQRSLASAMDQPPVLTEVVADAEVHPTYRTNVEYMAADVRMAPVPQVRNPAVSAVLAEMGEVTPGLGQIVQAALTDGSSDWRSALTTFAEQMTAERERAIESVAGDGAEVGVEDWRFEDWTPGEDHQQ